MPAELVLLVDDEPNIIQLARLYLEREGFQVEAVVDGLEALQAVERLHPAMLVLDLMLPGLDGMEVCRRLRTANNPVPILMVTARDEDIDKILGLELGADDYMTKPFNPRELVARVKAILRRIERKNTAAPAAPERAGDLEIDTARREVRVNGQPIELRTQEFEVLLVLVQNKGLVLSREQLLNKAWGFEFYGQSRTVDVHIGQLRRRLSGSRVRIETVTGVGYKLVV
jgi:two-component system, OmpR family, alkaline phosphatase synthesis response regulator PhoP